MHALPRLVCAVALPFTASVAAFAQSPTPDIGPAVEKGLQFVTVKTLKWKEEHGCASCHHAPMMLWSCNEARKHGFAVDEAAVKNIREWMQAPDNAARYFPAATTPMNQRGGPLGGTYLLAALASGPDSEIDYGAVKRFADYYAKVQEEDGSWVIASTMGRPPFFGGAPETTRMVRLALAGFPEVTGTDVGQPSSWAADAWLSTHMENLTQQEIALNLMIAARLGRPAAEIENGVAGLLALQNSDGGWSQTTEMQGDAWATGQALYALAAAGKCVNDPAVAKGVAYLVAKQREDGTWQMASRLSVGVEPSMARSTASPEPITVAATAWAVMGLVTTKAE